MISRMQKQTLIHKGRLGLISQWQLYLLCLPAIVYLFLFNYMPMAGVQIAFKDYSYSRGIVGSSFVGLKHFYNFASSYRFWALVWNTVAINIYSLIAFPIPILFALILNCLDYEGFKKVVQTVSYAPHFISVVVMCGMVLLFTSPTSGVINTVIKLLGGTPKHFMADPGLFRPIYIISDIWQSTGWNAIMYIAALAAISPELYEAARVDGASRYQIAVHIEVPCIMPTIIIMSILKLGSMMNVGFSKAYMLQNEPCSVKPGRVNECSH